MGKRVCQRLASFWLMTMGILAGSLGSGLSFADTDSSVAARRDYQVQKVAANGDQTVYGMVRNQKGDFWFGTEKGVVYYRDNKPERFEVGTKVMAERVYSLFLDSKERLWLGYGAQLEGKPLAVTRKANGSWQHFGGIESSTVFSFTEDKLGNIYAGAFFGRGGLYVQNNDRFEHSAGFTESVTINNLYTDNKGLLWLATTDSGIFNFDPASGEKRQYATSTARVKLSRGFQEVALPNNDIRSIGQDSDGNFWFGGELEKSERQPAGLVRFDRKQAWTVFDRSNSGLPDERVFRIVPDSVKGVWLATASGAVYFDGKDWQVFNVDSGLPAGAINDLVVVSPYDIWLATQKGVWRLVGANLPGAAALEVKNLGVSVGDSEAVLYWVPPADRATAAGYVVKQSLDQGKTFSERATLAADDYFIRLKNLTNDAIYVFQVLVKMQDDSLSQGVTITAIPQEKTMPLPLAHAGDNQVVVLGSEVVLDGSKSQYFTDSASYRWTLEQGPMRAVQFDSRDIIHPRFLPTASGQYFFSLLITDAKGQKSLATDVAKVTVEVKALGDITKPLARLKVTDLQVQLGDTVTLDASESLFSTTKASFQWDLLEGPVKSVKWDLADIARPHFPAETAGAYRLRLTITDALGQTSDPVEARVLVNEPETYTLFKDLSDSHWSRAYFASLKERQIITGYADGTVRPLQAINRAEFLKLVFAIAGLTPDPENTNSPYKDVTDPNEWFFPLVTTAVKEGIIQGKVGALFYPSRPITRVEALKILLKAAKLAEGETAKVDFTDVKLDDWYFVYVGRALRLKLVSGFGDGTFRPQQNITRAEAAKLMALLRQTAN